MADQESNSLAWQDRHIDIYFRTPAGNSLVSPKAGQLYTKDQDRRGLRMLTNTLSSLAILKVRGTCKSAGQKTVSSKVVNFRMYALGTCHDLAAEAPNSRTLRLDDLPKENSRQWLNHFIAAGDFHSQLHRLQSEILVRYSLRLSF